MLQGPDTTRKVLVKSGRAQRRAPTHRADRGVVWSSDGARSPTRCGVCSRLCVSNTFSHFRQNLPLRSTQCTLRQPKTFIPIVIVPLQSGQRRIASGPFAIKAQHSAQHE